MDGLAKDVFDLACGINKIKAEELRVSDGSLQVEQYENILKFLDCASRKTKDAAKEKDLDTKVALCSEAKRIDEARSTLRLLYYAYEDYVKDGEYTPPLLIATEKITISVPKIVRK